MKLHQLLGGLVPLVGLVAGHPTCNNECNRGCWSNGFDVLSDWEAKWPITGKTNIVCYPSDKALGRLTTEADRCVYSMNSRSPKSMSGLARMAP